MFFKSIGSICVPTRRQDSSPPRVDCDVTFLRSLSARAALRVLSLIVAFASIQTSANAQGWADASTAATGQRGGYNTDYSWQNAVPQAAPGNADAGLGRSFFTGSQGSGSINGAQLPEVNTGLNAVLSGFNKPAVRQFGSGGFSGGGAKPYTGPYSSGGAGGMLPPCAMTPCDFDVAEVGGGPGGGGDDGFHGGGDNYGYHGGDGGGSFSGGGDNYGYHGGGGSGGDAYSFHGGN
ncbi:MAG: hypothetical protein K2W95_33890 [Candidatus Obscuribacterales bacterium]|nr:hypothetical protein [Candidatus Obscuribacterales bacterium]